MATSTTSQLIQDGFNSAPRGPVDVVLNFITRPADGSAPFTEKDQIGITAKESHQVPMVDIRGLEGQFSLDRDAFQTLQNISSATTYETFDTESEIQRVYYPEVEKLLLNNVPGANHVVILGHGVRKQKQDGHRQPILFVHADHTAQTAEELVRQHVNPKVVHEMLQLRYRIISVWRPLNGTVLSTPIGFASAASLDEKDMFPTQIRYSDRLAWFTGLKYNLQQRWHYWSGMQSDERLLLKCTDTASGVGKQAAHSAFLDPRAPLGVKPRESIEVRALVFG